ncbi:hypothetical protein LTR86_008049 [Recurvomyces mirabilis]|nr:hypothetical protein LTR86_008049 [Recurvomyces mirabilis]
MSTHDSAELKRLASELAARVGDQLPAVILQLLKDGVDLTSEPLQLDCSLRRLNDALQGPSNQIYRLASVGLEETTSRGSPVVASNVHSTLNSPIAGYSPIRNRASPLLQRSPDELLEGATTGLATPTASPIGQDNRVAKARKANTGLRVSTSSFDEDGIVTRHSSNERSVSLPRKKRLPDNPALQPSTLDKYIGGVWDSIYSSIKLDPTEVIEQWQAIESSGQPRLLVDTERELAVHHESAVQGVFGRMSILTRKAHWVRCFEDRVADLGTSLPREKAKKQTIAEACLNFSWSEKELRNKMAIWKGYHDIMESGGWAALVFAGAGLYRFCKYRVSFTEETFATLHMLRHRFEVAADTLHPRWRQLLGIIGGPTERKYNGHPHDHVVCGASNEAIPLPITYHQWDKHFAYEHLDESMIDEEVWGEYDPRLVTMDTSNGHKCQQCHEPQSDDPRDNRCQCYPNLYGGTKAGATPVQVYRTPNGKNNGLLACCAFEPGSAVGEFVGQITSGLQNMDVMVGQTDKAVYQIWQGRKGNFTRFVNHSCQPNSQYERFVWLGTQRIVLMSMGIEAGKEITVDYSESYWKNLDKVCLCGHEKCRYRNRDRDRNLLSAASNS